MYREKYTLVLFTLYKKIEKKTWHIYYAHRLNEKNTK